MKLWKYNKITGLWNFVRSFDIESNAKTYLGIFQRQEPNETFKLSKTKPKYN
jgi:hypothetical protein